MSVAAASDAVSTPHHQPTPEQIRLARLIDDKKHDHPEVQEIVRRVLDVVANSSQEDAVLALFDCDYDFERTVALLIERGNEISSEWRTATNHKSSKKQQQKIAATKNGLGGETDENVYQRGHDGYTYRGKSRGGRSRIRQQYNESDFQNNTQQQQNDYYTSQPRHRGRSGYRGRQRISNRGSHRGNDRNYQQTLHEQQPQGSNIDSSISSDTAQGSIDVSYRNRRGGSNSGGHSNFERQQHSDGSDWNGDFSNFPKSNKVDEQSMIIDNTSASNARSAISNGSTSSSGTPTVNNVLELNAQQKLTGDFDPVEAARQIKHVIGIGLSQQQNTTPPKPLMDLQPMLCDQQIGQQQKSNIVTSKSSGPNLNTKVTPPPPPRIPHQPVIFSDRFDGGINKIDVQFGNLGEPFEEPSSQNISSVSASTSSASAFYSRSEPMVPLTKPKNTPTSVQHLQHSTTSAGQHQATEQSTFISTSTHINTARPNEQHNVTNQQHMMPPQIQQQPSITMKPVVPPQYAVHHQQHQMNPQNLHVQSLLYHQQQESVPFDTSYDPTPFQLPPFDINPSYYIAAPMNQQQLTQQQSQQRYLVSQPQQPPQQLSSNRQQPSSNIQTPPLSTSTSNVSSSSTSTVASTVPKKGPAVPPGIILSTAPPSQATYSGAYSTTYSVPPSIGAQQQTGTGTYSTSYDNEHLFTNQFLQLTNVSQTQSPSGTYGSVTPPVQQQNQSLNNNDNKTINYRASINDNLLFLPQFQQFTLQQPNTQQQGPQTGHSPAPINYFLGHSTSGPNYSPGPQIMYAQPTTAMTQQQVSKQQGQQYNQNNSSTISGNDDYYSRSSVPSSSNKEAHYMYAVSGQPQQVSSQSTGQHQSVNKQQQTQQHQRTSGNIYNNQQSQQRPF